VRYLSLALSLALLLLGAGMVASSARAVAGSNVDNGAPPVPGPTTLSSFLVNGVVTAASYGGTVLPARAFLVQAVRFRVSVAASGAGTVTLRASDGTNNCDAAVSCALATTNTSLRQAAAPSAGSCTFPASATITYSVASSTCAVTQPLVLGTVDVEGTWQ
jgi:hypothetical protein